MLRLYSRNKNMVSQKSERFVSPPIKDLYNLRQPLTAGEWLVFNLFNNHLAPEWEIYIQPHLNGLRPDFVLLNPNVGIAVFEVKDWNLDAMKYWSEPRINKIPKLWADDYHNSYSIQDQNPIEKIYRYKQEIFNLYCPRLAERAGFAAITSGVIFPFAKQAHIRRLLNPSLAYRNMLKWHRYNPLAGAEAIAQNDIDKVFPENKRNQSRQMTEDLAKDMRNWLIEPDYAATQRQPIELDAVQKSYVNTCTQSGFRRIKGAAGSGKSLILAARAAKLASQGKHVLVVTYNITLLHYLRDVAVRWSSANGQTKQAITWLHFHAWCKRVCQQSDREKDYYDLCSSFQNQQGSDNDVLNKQLPELVKSCIEQDNEHIIQRYDAILVDEGQDFLPTWWDALKQVRRKNGEMLLVADATQDIYATAKSWTDEAMVGAGFSGGKWVQLKTCYRIPPTAMEAARNFAKQYLPLDKINLPIEYQGELEFYPCQLRWIQITPANAVFACAHEILKMAPAAVEDILAITDITFLTGNQTMGKKVVDLLESKGVNTVHTFSHDKMASRRMKIGFYMGNARIKATTLHSFKGWESRAIVLFVPEHFNEQIAALIYTGLTRLKRHEKGSYLTVVSCSKTLIEYGKTWPSYEEK